MQNKEILVRNKEKHKYLILTWQRLLQSLWMTILA